MFKGEFKLTRNEKKTSKQCQVNIKGNTWISKKTSSLNKTDLNSRLLNILTFGIR